MNSLQTLNISMVNEITQSQFINLANNIVAIPSLILALISICIVFLIVGFVMVKKQGRGKFLTIWLISTIVSGIIVFFIIINPNVIQNLLETLKGGNL